MKIGESHPIDENLRPVKVLGETTALELSKDKVRTKDLETNTITLNESFSGNLVVEGDISTNTGNLKILTEGKGLWFENTTFKIYKESGSDQLNFQVGGAVMMKMHEGGIGEWIELNNTALCQTQNEPGYDATDTYAFFTTSNKLHLTFGAGNITDIHLIFPDGSCNCTLLITQDGTGSRTITNWKTFDETGSGNESTVKWAGGTAPTLTTTGNKTDIISFYWDNDNHRAYGVASLNF